MWNILAVEMMPLMAEAGQASGEDALRKIENAKVTVNIELRGVFDQVNREAVDYANERAAEMVGKKMVNGILIENPNPRWTITDPTRNWLREQIEKAFEDGMSPAQLAKAIRGNYAFSKARAKMIAFTEVGNINVRTHAEASKKSGATHKRSFLSADHDHDDFCDDAEAAGEVPIDYDYGFGLKWPLYHPLCRCSESFYWRKAEIAA